ncbi:hypothetical protein QUW03_07770 [Faecalicoccus acidiformans]|uniref:hypothetical protein n=1 Tax=Faecalicoccus acidiformans TaxID=915173 RepID=UPI0025A35407|nr:hypothetical protein [Faecalicoccus acidiformans]MDM8204265.1 hypothetical protein [Faecalicoccus acidiformans]
MASQGEVKFKVTIDDSAANVKIDKLETNMEDLGDTAKKSLNQADFSDMAKGANQASGSMDDLAKKTKQASEQMDGLGQGMEKLPDQTKPASQGFTVFKGILANLGANVIQTVIGKVMDLGGSLMELVDATEEYRSMQAKVSASASSFGYDMEFAKDQYAEFYRYVSDDQMATNAITNLMGMKVSTDTVSDAARGAIGVWASYGDSIPIESLTESITESARVAQVTGTLADAINWAERSNEDWTEAMKGHSAAQAAFNKAIAEGETQEDAYSAALAACADTQERADLIAQTLNQTYGESKKTYDELSQSTLDMHDSELKLKDAQADLAESMIPLKTQMNVLKAQGLEALKPAVDKASKAMQNMTEDIDWEGFGDMAEDAVGIVTDAMSFCIDHSEELTAALKGGAVAFGIYKTASVASSAAQKVANAVLKISTENTLAAAAAEKVLAAAKMATPWGLVAGLIAGVSVGLVAYISNLAETAKVESENAIATDEMRQKYEDLHESIKSNQQAREENLASAEAETLVAENLATKIEELAGKENKSNAEKELMAGYVDELNKIYPDLNAQYDAEADKLNMSTQEIRDYISASKDMILAKAAQQNLVAVAEDLATAQLNLAEAQEVVTKNQEAATKADQEATEAKKAYDDAVKNNADNVDELKDKWIEASLASADANATLEESKEVMDDCQKEVDDLGEEFDKTGEQIEGFINTDEFKKKVDDLVAKTREAGIEVPDALAQGIKDGKYALPQSVEEMTALVTYDSLLKKADKAGITVPESITKGIQSGQILPSKAASQMQNLITFDDLLKKSEAAGHDVPQYLQDQILAGSMKPEEAVQYMKDLIDYNDMLNEASKAGVTVPENLKNGVNSGQTKPRDAMEQIKQLILQKETEAVDASGPKGAAVSSNFGSNIGSESSKKTVRDNTASVVGAAEDEFSKGDASDSGYFLSAGFGSGILSGIGTVASAAKTMVQNAIATIKRTGGEGSPWKTTKINGRFAAQGLAMGILDEKDTVVSAAETTVYDMTNTMYQTMESTMSGLPRVMADSFNASMPLAERSMESRIDRMKSKMQDIIGSTATGRMLGGNLEYAGSNGMTVNQTTNNMNQTINSPKHTSPSENAREAEKMIRRLAWQS